MNHSDIGKHLADYLEGELPIDERALVDAHLDECGACTRELDEMLQTIRLLRELPEPEVPPMIAANVMRRIRSGEARPGFVERVGRALGAVIEPGFVLPASAIAAAALVITIFQGVGELPTSEPTGEFQSVGRAEQSVSSLAGTMAPAWRADGSRVQPVPGSADASDIAARVERRASHPTRVADRPASGASSGQPRTSAPQIRIQLEQFLVSRPVNAGMPRDMNVAGQRPTPQLPAGWGMEGNARSARARSNDASMGTLVTAERFGPSDSASSAGSWAQSDGHSGADPRDAWLALGLEEPRDFARYIAAQNLAEQELWATRLSERARSRGLLDELLETLRASGDPTAAWVADDFAAQANRETATSNPPAGAPLR